jgi:tryptophan-rich sensory protein
MNYSKLIISLIIPQIAGAIGAVFTTSSISGWYAILQKPSFSPPNWIFGPVWTALFLLMGISLYLVWNNGAIDAKTKNTAFIIFGIQLALNVLWSILFFGLKSPGASLMEIFLLIVAIIINAVYFYKISPVAGWLFLPYILWTSFASVLNFFIWKLN